MGKIWVIRTLLILSSCYAITDCQLFNCLRSSDSSSDEVFYPNISDIFFEHYNAVLYPTYNMYYTVFYTVPFSPTRRNCFGNVVSIKYCYQISNREWNKTVTLFKVVLGNRTQSSFVVNKTITVLSRPGNIMCTARPTRKLVCCDTSEVPNQHLFYIPSAQFTYGIKLYGRLIMYMKDVNVSWYQYYLPGQVYQFRIESRHGPMLLLRFSVVPHVPSPTEPSTSTTEPSTASLTTEDATDDHETLNMGSVDDGGSNVSLIGGVSGVVAGILVLVLVIVCIIILWLHLKRNRKSVPITSTGLREISNAVYGEDLKYADVGPAGLTSIKKEAQPKDSEYSYAEWGASHGATHEVNSLLIEENIYMVPPCSEDALYSQLDGMAPNLLRHSLSLSEFLGSGQFGAVYRGIWRRRQEEVQVAVKTLKEGAKEEDRVKFLQEAAIMGQFKHPNVVTMHGVVKEGEPILLVLELLVKGDLRGHLLKTRSGTDEGIDCHILLSYCRQVVSGMLYLSSKAFVHRDLAARNILMSEEEICKIADFGMSRDLMYESFYVSHGGMIPVKWTAPEALYYKTYSTASDVWSFGALMYEIWSVGHKPFEALSNNKVLSAISSGVRMAPPPGCPRRLYNIMIDCWHPESSQRPSFMDLTKKLSLPDPKLLLWSDEDRSVHPEADRLGADQQCARELYKDLQTKYLEM